MRLVRIISFKIERDTVHAESQAGRLRPIGEDMAQMPVTPGTAHFNTRHAMGSILHHG